MNLAEIALSLGCAPGMVLCPGSSFGMIREEPDGQGGQKHCPAPLLPGEEVADEDAAAFARSYAALMEQPWGNFLPTGASIDSRETKPGHLFFCLPGERADGHDFALAAARAGACAVVAARNPYLTADCSEEERRSLPPVFLTENPLTALWRLAVCHRDTSLAKVIGITGTAGKTSVKEVLAGILSLRGQTERNPLNLNNQIGLPLSMLNASADASFWVLEAGISEAHDMDELGRILRPDVAVILNVGDAHLNGLGEQGVAACKAVFLDYIAYGGEALVSADYEDLSFETERRRESLEERQIILRHFSALTRECFAFARYLGEGDDFSGEYAVVADGREFSVQTCFSGDFGSENVAAIAAVALRMGLGVGEIKRGFATAKLPEQRFKARRYGNFIIVDDSYNANPLSSSRMIHAGYSRAKKEGLPFIAVMGEMLELGDIAESAHVTLGQILAAVSPELVFWKGGQAEAVLRGLRQGGYTKAFYPVGGGQDFSLLLEELALTGGLFLFKGSRGNRLERLVDILRERVDPAGEDDAV